MFISKRSILETTGKAPRTQRRGCEHAVLPSSDDIQGTTTLVAHDDKMAVLTAYYNNILGRAVATSWGFDLRCLYNTT